MPNTFHIAQSFRREGKKLVADPAQKTKTAEAAVAMAQRLARTKAGAVAYSISGDPELDAMDEPVVLFRAGELPGELQE